MLEQGAKYIVSIKWLEGVRHGVVDQVKSIEKPRVGSVRKGAWGSRYKVIKVEAIEEK
jgi:hypothetical protein